MQGSPEGSSRPPDGRRSSLPTVADRSDVVTLHASLRGLAAVWATPVLLVALGGASWWQVGPHPIPQGMVVVGVAMLGFVLLAYPTRVELDREGVHRVCLLRTGFVPWTSVGAIERGRPSSASVIGNLRAAADERTVSGGLFARGRDRRRWLLTDQVESQEEYDRLRDLLRSLTSPVALRATRPHRGAPPTDVYRRRRT
jgi:hypothetical protein